MHFLQLRFQEIRLGLDRRADKRDQGERRGHGWRGLYSVGVQLDEQGCSA